MLIESISLRRHADTLRQPVVKVSAVTVYVLKKRHNAWHGTTTNHFSLREPMFTSHWSAEAAAEKRRVRGSYFEISQRPAIAFQLPKATVVVTELNAHEPLKRWTIPTSWKAVENRLHGMEVLQGFGYTNIGHAASGWSSNWSKPTVLIGVTSDGAIEELALGDMYGTKQSYVLSGFMFFRNLSTDHVSSSSIKSIKSECAELEVELGHRPCLRVHELASELGVRSRDVLDTMAVMGLPAKSASSSIPNELMESLRQRILGGGPSR